jgi:hypothetical protein
MTLDSTPGAEQWEPWTPLQVAERLRGCRSLWGIAGGWALDLWLGRATRAHGDMEIAIARSALGEIGERLGPHILYAAKDGLLKPLDDAGADQAGQVWVLDPVAGKWRLDLLLDPGDESLWIYRRDARVQSLRRDVIASTAEGIPYLRPHVVLLFKARNPRPKDQIDLAECLGELDRSQRDWLRDALLTAHPQSPWLGLLV